MNYSFSFSASAKADARDKLALALKHNDVPDAHARAINAVVDGVADDATSVTVSAYCNGTETGNAFGLNVLTALPVPTKLAEPAKASA